MKELDIKNTFLRAFEPHRMNITKVEQLLYFSIFGALNSVFEITPIDGNESEHVKILETWRMNYPSQ